jgi:hypothetical protein
MPLETFAFDTSLVVSNPLDYVDLFFDAKSALHRVVREEDEGKDPECDRY